MFKKLARRLGSLQQRSQVVPATLAQRAQKIAQDMEQVEIDKANTKNAPPAPRPREQVEIINEIVKSKKLATMPQSKMPQANTVPLASVDPANPGTPSSGLGSGGAGQQTLASGPSASMPTGFGSSNRAMPTSVADTQPGGGFNGGEGFKKGGKIKSKSKTGYSSGGKTGKASSRGDGIAQRGKTKGRMI